MYMSQNTKSIGRYVHFIYIYSDNQKKNKTEIV